VQQIDDTIYAGHAINFMHLSITRSKTCDVMYFYKNVLFTEFELQNTHTIDSTEENSSIF